MYPSGLKVQSSSVLHVKPPQSSAGTVHVVDAAYESQVEQVQSVQFCTKATVGVDPSHEYVSRVYLASVVPNGGAISGLKLFGLKLYSPVSPWPF